MRPASPLASTSSSICSTRVGAPPCSGPGERADGRRHRRGAVGAGRGGDARGEGRGVQPVLGGRDPVGVDRLDVPRVGLAAPADQELRGRVLALLDLALGHRRPSPRADWATIESAAAERRARSSRASSASMSTSCPRPHFGPSVASPAWRSAIAEPLGSWSSIALGLRHPRLEAVVDQQAPDLLERVRGRRAPRCRRRGSGAPSLPGRARRSPSRRR